MLALSEVEAVSMGHSLNLDYAVLAAFILSGPEIA
jgi:hypothetical protein